MSAIRNIPIARKMTIAFGIVCILCLLLGAFTTFTFHGISTSTLDVSANGFPSVVHLSEARQYLNVMRLADLDLMRCQKADCTAKYSAMRQEALSQYQAEIKAYESFIADSSERALYEKLTAAFSRYLEAGDQAAALLAANKTGEAVDRFSSEATVNFFSAASNGPRMTRGPSSSRWSARPSCRR